MRNLLSKWGIPVCWSADRGTGIPHFDSKWKIERYIQATGMPYTILRPVFFMENWLGMRQQIEQGSLALPLKPETRLQMIAVDDIGGFAAAAFEKPGHWQGQTRDIAGDELAMSEVADKLGRSSGREVQYRQIPWDESEQKMGGDLTRMWRWFEEVGYHVDISVLRQEYPQLTGFDRWLGTHWVLRKTA